MESSKFNIQNPEFNNSSVQIGDSNTMNVTNNNSSLHQIAIEIQEILEDISKSYPTNTTTEKMSVATAAIQRIENHPTLYQKVISALKAGSTEALAQLINHPAASFAIAAFADWIKYDRSNP